MAQNSQHTCFIIGMWKPHTISQSVDHETTHNCARFDVCAQRGLVFIFPISELQGPTYLLEKKSLFFNVREITKSNSEKLKFVFLFQFNFSGKTGATWLIILFLKIT